jgi:hypothetical protein
MPWSDTVLILNTNMTIHIYQSTFIVRAKNNEISEL